MSKRRDRNINSGSYRRKAVSNLDNVGNDDARHWFDEGLVHFYGYHHEEAAKCFLRCLSMAPHCALAHGMVSLCHVPNYNFNGDVYYETTFEKAEPTATAADPNALNEEGLRVIDVECGFPSQMVAARHSEMAMEIANNLRRRNRRRSSGSAAGRQTKAKEANNEASMISERERMIISATRLLTQNPGIESSVAEEVAGRPYTEAMKKIYLKHPNDPEVVYLYVSSLMVRNAWKLYEYPTGKALSSDVDEIRRVIEMALVDHSSHPGLSHLYIHLCEMSTDPGKALSACEILRTEFPDCGHLIHMPTHIDVLLGDYEACVEYNIKAVEADTKIMSLCVDTSSTTSFYFGYFVHNFHMLVYGALLGGMQQIAMEFATRLNHFLTEELFLANPELVTHLESYSAVDIHILIRFGRWDDILNVPLPLYVNVMVYRTATIHMARALAFASRGDVVRAKIEADLFDKIRMMPSISDRVLHNNDIVSLFAVDALMLRGEIAYREEKYDEAFSLLRKSVQLQDALNYDEPWGKMQPVRHALGGLLSEQNRYEEAEHVFRKDLHLFPENPWSLVGLIHCLEFKQTKEDRCCFNNNSTGLDNAELIQLRSQLIKQRQSKWADFEITVSCACCQSLKSQDTTI